MEETQEKKLTSVSPVIPVEEEKKPLDKFLAEIRLAKPTDAGRICSLIDAALVQIETEADKKAFAKGVKEHMGKAFKKSKARKKLEIFSSD